MMGAHPTVGGEPTGDPFLAVIAGLQPHVFTLSDAVTVIGRLPELAISLDHVEVSRRHCELRWSADGFAIADLGSRWGTKVNQTRIAAPTPLRPGDRIQVGPVTLLFGLGEPPLAAAGEPVGAAAGTILFQGRPAERIPLGEELTVGRDPEAALVLDDPSVSRRHAVVRRTATGFHIEDLRSSAGSFANGRRFDEHELVIGDRLQIGPFFFRFDGQALLRASAVPGAAIEAADIALRIGPATILDGISLAVAPGQFVGIIGPSGAGKSTLLDVLSAMRPPTAGTATIDGTDVYRATRHPTLGFVPQDDIVHRELRVAEALRFAAQLRLPRGTPPFELHKLIVRTLHQLGLRDRAQTRIQRLSGGQRKRVSVGAELVARPAVLFLDEPTSGLDPATEFKLMELLRDLADSGCTIVCTTHVMENVYLMDRLAVIHRGRLLFAGSPAEVRDHFGVNRLSGLYDHLEAVGPGGTTGTPAAAARHPSTPRLAPRPPAANRPAALPVLLARMWAILRSDWRNFAILLGQPLLIGGLVSWVSDDASLVLFFAAIASLWLGCGNAAQEIVRELPIYRRERVVGIGRLAYLTGKFLFLSATTIIQALLLYLVLLIGERNLPGTALWQLLGLVGAACSGVGIGCAISTLARTQMQAVLFVPIVVIPLILLSGHPIPAHEMTAPVYATSRLTPSFAAQTLMDTSFLWRQPIARATIGDHWTSFRNVNRQRPLKTGEVFTHSIVPLAATATHAVWLAAMFALAAWALRRRERG